MTLEEVSDIKRIFWRKTTSRVGRKFHMGEIVNILGQNLASITYRVVYMKCLFSIPILNIHVLFQLSLFCSISAQAGFEHMAWYAMAFEFLKINCTTFIFTPFSLAHLSNSKHRKIIVQLIFFNFFLSVGLTFITTKKTKNNWYCWVYVFPHSENRNRIGTSVNTVLPILNHNEKS